jgi:hypothetical protein
MSLRRIRETIALSRKLMAISPEAFRLWVVLLTQTDDYGIFIANPHVILGRCFPLLMDKVNIGDVKRWMAELIDAHLVHVYDVDSKWYVRYVGFQGHNPLRNDSSKFPGPEGHPITKKTYKSVVRNWDNRERLESHVRKCEQKTGYSYHTHLLRKSGTTENR